MKKILPLISILAIGMLASCNSQASNIEKKPAAVEGISIDLNSCTIGPNSVSFEQLMGGTFESMSSSGFKNNLKNKTKIIADAINSKPTKTLDWGSVWDISPEKTAFYLGMGSIEGRYYLKLFASAGQADIKPKINERATPSEIESLFKNEIINKQAMNNGTLINFELLLCNQYKASIDVPTSLGVKKMPKDDLDKYYPLDVAIYGDASVNISNTKHSNNSKSYSSGDRVCSTFGKNSWCGVVVKRLSGAVEVKVNDVNCGGMLCTGLQASGCTGNTFLDVGYSGKNIVVKNGCLD